MNYKDSPKSEPNETSSLARAIEELVYVTRWLRMLSLYILVCAMGSSSAFALFEIWKYSSINYALWCSLASSGFGIMVTFVFEQMRKRGNALFEEISNELQYYILSENNAPTKMTRTDTAKVKPNMSMRIALRAFSQSSELPFFPGRFGPGIYVMFFVGCTIAVAIISRTTYHSLNL